MVLSNLILPHPKNNGAGALLAVSVLEDPLNE